MNHAFTQIFSRASLLFLCGFFALTTPLEARATDRQETLTLDEAPPLADPPPPNDKEASEKTRNHTQWTIREVRDHERPQELDLSLGVWPDTFSAALWYAVPIVPDGFIREINDSFALEFGMLASLLRNADGIALAGALIPAIGGRWNFHLTRTWTTFATLKLAARFGLGNYNPSWFDLNAAAGAIARLNDAVSVRMDIGYPAGLSLGLTFPLG